VFHLRSAGILACGPRASLPVFLSRLLN
jgi:hypothetical protein